MGALSYNRSFLARGKSIDTGEWVYGNYVEMVIDSIKHHYIYPYPKNANSGNHSYTPQPVDCSEESISRFTGITDYSGDYIYEHDTVMLPTGQTGEVIFCLGTWGVSTYSLDNDLYDTIDWKLMEKRALSYRKSTIELKDETVYVCHFQYADNFISFYELFENFCPESEADDSLEAVCLTEAKELGEYREIYAITKE